MKRLALSVLLMLFSCTPTVYVHSDAPGHEATIEAAGELLDMPVEITGERKGAVDVTWIEQQGRRCGRATDKNRCRMYVVSCDNPAYLAHEIGHAMGESHTCRVEGGPRKDRHLPLCSEEHEVTLMDAEIRKGAEFSSTQNARLKRRAVATETFCR